MSIIDYHVRVKLESVLSNFCTLSSDELLDDMMLDLVLCYRYGNIVLCSTTQAVTVLYVLRGRKRRVLPELPTHRAGAHHLCASLHAASWELYGFNTGVNKCFFTVNAMHQVNKWTTKIYNVTTQAAEAIYKPNR